MTTSTTTAPTKNLTACGVSQSENRCKDVCEANSPRPSISEDGAVKIMLQVPDTTTRIFYLRSLYRALLAAGVIRGV